MLKGAFVAIGSEELANAADNLKDVDDAADSELLLVEIGIYRNIPEEILRRPLAENLDGANGVKNHCVYLAELNVVEGAWA